MYCANLIFRDNFDRVVIRIRNITKYVCALHNSYFNPTTSYRFLRNKRIIFPISINKKKIEKRGTQKMRKWITCEAIYIIGADVFDVLLHVCRGCNWYPMLPAVSVHCYGNNFHTYVSCPNALQIIILGKLHYPLSNIWKLYLT
jgi:hypothetical protein